MKRLTYVSRLNMSISNKELEAMGLHSQEKNLRVGITGVLIYFKELFFQIIEGADSEIDTLFKKIRMDLRHKDILCLKTENDIGERLFPTWSMNVINLDNNTDILMSPIKNLLQTITESHRIIEQYTQPTVLNIINKGLNPLHMPARKVEKIVLFADIVSFSEISEQLPVEFIVEIINRFFEITSRIITAAGGEVTKYIGDCVMAYFDPELADNAIQGCIDILRELKLARENAARDNPISLLHCGIGLSQGVVIEGNMGSAIKTDYTIIGDQVNTASRVEDLTRQVKKAIVVTERVKNSTTSTFNFVPLGKYSLKGKNKAFELFYPDHDLVNDFDIQDIISQKMKRLYIFKGICKE